MTENDHSGVQSLVYFPEGREAHHTVLICLQISASDIVLLQAFLDTAEHLATVRTVDREKSVIALYSTVNLLDELLSFLDNLRNEIVFKYIDCTEEVRRTLIQ